VQRLGYQALGFAVWKGATFYLRSKAGGNGRSKVIPAVLVAGAVAAGAIAAKRGLSNGDD